MVWVISADGRQIELSQFSTPPANVTMYTATTTDGYRDFRLHTCRSGPNGNCTTAGGAAGTPTGHAVPYMGTVLAPVTGRSGMGPTARHGGAVPAALPRYVGHVAAPPNGQWTTFFLEARWAADDGGFRFTTQQSIVPVAFPFVGCVDNSSSMYNCKRMV